ncbi:MAG: FtsQ-type POTRA domain-containing protein [Deltaproteobacteria bacterium]|nr:FtsQ-type POTRA domain-containing protein [Deltaproteobacteria bacterium]
MRKSLKKQRVRASRHGDRSLRHNRRKSSRIPVGDIIRDIGSGVRKALVFLSVLTAVSLTFVMIYNYLLTSPYMKLAHVEIRGVDKGLRNELLQMCGLTSEQGLLNLKLEALKRKMEDHPWVRTATVERKFPDTLIVQVQKEEPVMLVLLDQFFYMNKQGRLFKPVSRDEEMDFPILTGLSKTDPGQKEKLDQTAHVLTVLKAQKDRWSIQNLSEIHLSKNGAISLYFNHIRAAIRISRHNPGRNMEELKQVAKHLSESGKINFVTQIDLNHVDGAIVSFKENQV